MLLSKLGSPRKYWIFTLLWATYFLCYCVRKPISIYKYYIESEYHLSKFELAWVDVALLLPYSCVQIFASSFWDQFRPGFVIFINLFLAALAMTLAMITQDLLPFCVMVFVSGAAQAPLWPACIKALTLSSASEKNLGTLVGFLGTAPYAGAAFSATLVTYVADRVGWRFSMVPILIACAIVAFLILGFLDAKRTDPTLEKKAESTLSLVQLLRFPGVPEMTLTAFFLKLTRYAFYMWLPIFLTESLSFSMTNAGAVSSVYYIGGALGGPIVGYFCDKSADKISVLSKTIFIGALSIASLAFIDSKDHTLIIVATFFVIGFASCGPDSVLIGAVTMEVGGEIHGARVTSLVNGIGTAGGLIEGPLIAIIANYWGWNMVLAFILVCTLLPAIVLAKISRDRTLSSDYQLPRP